MKKLLALLFVCAGLTAMAAQPVQRVQLTKADIAKAKVETKANIAVDAKVGQLTKQFTQNMVKPSLAPQNVLSKQNIMMRAPKRVASDVVYGNKIAFYNLYDWSQEAVLDENGEETGDYTMTISPSDDVYYGGESTTIADDGTLSNLLYFGDLPMTIDLDANTATFEISDGYNIGAEFYQADTTKSGRTTYIDNYYYLYWLRTADYFMDEDAELTDIVGEIGADGSIYFDDAIAYYYAIYSQRTTISPNGTSSTGDLTRAAGPYLSSFMNDLMIVTPNATHEYTSDYDGESSNDVLMYQVNDTVVVWNLWDFGMHGNLMTIDANAEVTFPAQYVYDFRETYMYNDTTDWGGDFYNLQEIDDQLYYGNMGTCNGTEIVWENCYITNNNVGYDFYTYNKLYYNDGSEFVIPAPAFLRGDVDNSGEVGISDVTTLIDHLLSGDLDDADDFNSDAADCDESGDIGIADVTALIDFLLNGTWGE